MLFSALSLVHGLALASVIFPCDSAPDWLIERMDDTQVTLTNSNGILTLSNGLITRKFATTPNFGTIDYRSEVTGNSIIRSIISDANVTLDGYQYSIGGIYDIGNTHAYLNRSSVNNVPDPNAFVYVGYSQMAPLAPFHWEPGLRFSPKDSSWPPKGLQLKVDFSAPVAVKIPTHKDIKISLHYEMYQGVPIMAKWISINYSNNSVVAPVRVNSVLTEILATQKPYVPWNYGVMPHPWERGSGITGSWLYVETDQAHGTTVQWVDDPQIGASPGADEPNLICSYTAGPGVLMANNPSDPRYLTQFVSFKVIELVTDTDDRERVALSRHRLTRLLNPQTQENPIFFHATNVSPTGFKNAIDQMVDVGFEMLIYSFGSGFNMESTSDSYLQQIKTDIDYAKSKGVEVGGYDLICLERGHGGYGGNVGDQWDALDPNSKQPRVDACFASGWYDKLRGIIFNFINKTGLSMVETDGPYGGGPCASSTHNHHIDVDDAIYWQTRLQGQLYADLKQINVFINQPDYYFYQGGNKVGMGYNENQYSLPRWQDLTVSRMSMYDDSYHFIPSQGWMFVPIVVYHGGGNAAMFEPLEQHLVEYEWALAQYLGYGVAACYRGDVLYDGPNSEALVKKWVTFYKDYRDIINSDIVHVKRPDMQGIDAILHVNPFIENKGLMMVYNPTSNTMTEDLTVPLYYTGLNSTALVLQEGQQPGKTYTLSRDYSIIISLNMAPQTITWFLFK